jgi:hypothetical protein
MISEKKKEKYFCGRGWTRGANQVDRDRPRAECNVTVIRVNAEGSNMTSDPIQVRPADDLIEAYGLELLKEPADWSIENGDLAMTADGDIKVGSTAYMRYIGWSSDGVSSNPACNPCSTLYSRCCNGSPAYGMNSMRLATDGMQQCQEIPSLAQKSRRSRK